MSRWRSARWRCWRSACRGLVPAVILPAPRLLRLPRGSAISQIGGQTGDTLGALQQAGEIAVLLVAGGASPHLIQTPQPI